MVGPAFVDVAKKYSGQADAQAAEAGERATREREAQAHTQARCLQQQLETLEARQAQLQRHQGHKSTQTSSKTSRKLEEANTRLQKEVEALALTHQQQMEVLQAQPPTATPEPTPTAHVKSETTVFSPMSSLPFQYDASQSEEDQVVPHLTASPDVANSLPPSPSTLVKRTEQAPEAITKAEVQSLTPPPSSEVREVQRLMAVIQERDHALAEGAAQLQQCSFLLAQRDTELMHTNFQLARASQRVRMNSHYPHHHQQQMAEINHLISRDRQQLHQHLHFLQDQVRFLQEQLHTAHADQRALQADFQQLQLQKQAWETEQSESGRRRYIQSQKTRELMREHKEAREATATIIQAAYRNLLTTVERGQPIIELQANPVLPPADVTRPKDVEPAIYPVAQSAVNDVKPELPQVAPGVPGHKLCDVKTDLHLCQPQRSTSVT